MANNLTNSILTQIAVKRLSGKAMSSGKFSIPQEEFGSTIQSSTETIFGQVVPNIPLSSSATQYQIQSASDGGPGTVQQVTFDLNKIAGTSYANVAAGSDQNASAAEETVFGKDLGDTTGFPGTTGTFHAYHITLPSNYVTLTNNANGGAGTFATHASTTKVLGTDAPFINGYASTGSTQFQIVPEYLSTAIGDGAGEEAGSNNYAIEILNDAGGRIAPTSGIDYYFDSYAGILFVQDPAAAFDASGNASVPDKVRGFLYVGKYQSEIESDDNDFHISGSVTGDGLTINNNTTSSFTSNIGLTISASNIDNSITFGYVTDTLTVTASHATSASYAATASHVVIDDDENTGTNRAIVFASPSTGTSSLFTDSSTFTYNPGTATLRIGEEENAGNNLQFRHAKAGNENFGIINFFSGSDGSINKSLHKLAINAGNVVNAGTIYIGTSSMSASAGIPAGTVVKDNDIYLGGHNSTTNIRGKELIINGGYTGWEGAVGEPALIVSGNFTLDLIETGSGGNIASASFTIKNIVTSSERTPLVIAADGTVTEADADFASDIVSDGGAVTTVVLSTGDTNQGALDLTVNGVVQDDNIVPFGLGNTDSPTFSNLTLTGDLTVEGTRTEIQVANLNVEDQFILLSSASATEAFTVKDSGIIVQTTSSAGTQSGSAFFRDADKAIWTLTSASVVGHSSTAVTIDLTTGSNTMAAVVGVQIDSVDPNGGSGYIPFQGVEDDYRYGQMYVDTTDTQDGGLYVYLPS